MIRFESASKTYTSLVSRRKVYALADFSMEIQRGEVIGIAGPNGAGKSTLISLLLGFLQPTAGRVTIDGQSSRRYVERHGISYLTELVNLPAAWKAATTLQRMAILSGLARSDGEARADALQTELGLDEHATKTVKQLSKGNLQRLGMAQSLLGDFDVVVLDEPTHGLDPLWTHRFRDLVAQLRRPDRVILIASHNLDELELLADRVAILNKGQLQKIVEHGSGAISAAPISWRINFEQSPDVAAVLAGAMPIEGRPGAWRVSATRTQMSGALGRLLTDGAVLIDCYPEESNLETAFRAAVHE